MKRTAVNPWSWSLNFGYNQAEMLVGATRHLVCAGQTSVDADGNPQHPGDMRSQIALALDNLEALLGAADMGLASVVRLNIYTTDVDEAMVDLPLLWQVVRRINDASLVLVGDPAQLPPIGFGLTFHALIEHPAIPRIMLDRVMRQSAATGIPAVADAIRNGRWSELPPFRGLEPGVTFVDAEPHEACDRIRDIGARLARDGLRRGDAQIIAPVNAGPAGILAINRRFHELRMQSGARARRPVPDRDDIAEGDPIVWTRNDYGRDLMNGSTGRIVGVDGSFATAVIDGQEHQLNAADGNSIDLAYAISVHKAQGSQWPLVIIPAFQSRILDRTLVYTATTRASRQVVLVGDRNVFRAAVERPPSSLSRDITLASRLRTHSG